MSEKTAQPLFKVLKGNPTDAEVAALAAAFAQVAAAGRTARDKERNLWGRRDPYRRGPQFNPNAFRSVTFF